MKKHQQQHVKSHRPAPAGETAAAPLAIVGMGCLFPRADGLGAYWANIREAVDAITGVPPTHWRPEDYLDADPKRPDHVYMARGGFLSPVDFNPMEFGIAPNAIEATDTTQLLGLVVAREALRDAGYGPERDFDRSRVSCVLGVTGTLPLVVPLGGRLGHPYWRQALREAGVADDVAEDVVARIADRYVGWQEASFPGLLGNVVAGRIANCLDLGGTNCVVDAACASALGALHVAAMELAAGRCDMVIGGGMDTFNDIFMYMCFSKTPALSPTGDARPYSADADGTALGEGLGAVVLKRLEDARRDGDRIYAVLRGTGSSSDGKGQAIYAPAADGQSLALRRAHENAGVKPETIELVEGHGTGTKAGDAAELASLLDVFRPSDGAAPWCALGSVKSQIGHTKAAAGMAGLIKAALALYFKVLPPTIKVKRPAEALAAGDTAFYVSTEKRPWLPRPGHPRRAGVSSFGFGGSNFHCVLEEADRRKTATDWDGLVQILPFSAESPEALGAALDAAQPPARSETLRRLAHALRGRFDAAAACRLVLVAEVGKTDVARLWRDARAKISAEPAARAWHLPAGAWYGSGSAAGKLAFLFPGQGGTNPGMLRDLTCLFPEMLDTLAEANAVLAAMPQHRLAPERLSDLIYPQPAFDADARKAHEEALRATDVAQPAIGALSLGAARLLDRFGVRPDAVAGHSYGELAALCAAGCFEPAALHALSRTRGSLMGAGEGDRGGMLAVRAGAEATEAALREAGLELTIANKNAPNQTVIAGESAALDRAAEALTAKGIQSTRLSVPAAFHSAFVAGARKPFRAALDAVAFAKPRIPVFANTTGQPYPTGIGAMRELLAGQLASAVEFVQEVENLYAAGMRAFVECGPGATLTGLVKAILGEREYLAVALDASRGKGSGLLDLARALAQLAAAGHAVDLKAWDPDYAVAHPAPAASDKPVFTIPICGANYVKPRPARPPRAASGKDQRDAKDIRDRRDTGDGMGRATEAGAAAHTVSAPAGVASGGAASPGGSVASVPSLPSAAPASWTLADALRSTQESMAALQQIQEHTARLHQQYLAGQEVAQRSLQALIAQQQQVLGSSFVAMPAPAPALAMPASGIAGSHAASPVPGIAEQRSAPSVTAIAEEHPAPSVARPVSPAAGPDVTAVLLAVIAEKTGYPAEMLDLDMGLDADLGIDSIKRVEILAALQERLPQAPVIKPEHLGTLQTLRQIAEFLSAGGPAVAAPATADVPSAPLAARSASAIAGPEVTAALLAVIAEKTGYPAEMLDLSMGLDADLGIDSIKRVEILAAIQERLPQAPVIKPEHLGTLQTLGQIVEFLSAGEASAAAPGTADLHAAQPAAGPAATVPAPAGVTRERVVEALLAVIAEKTGYPAEMLDMDMGLDADLGIDSIKRVEILAAIQERLPEAPVIKPEHLGTLQTLGQIADFLSAGEAGATAPVAAELQPAPFAAATSAEPAPAASARGIERLVLSADPLDGAEARPRMTPREGSHVWVLSEASELGWKLREELLGRRLRPLLVSIRELKKMPRPDLLAGLIVLAPSRGASDGFLREAFQVLRTAAPSLRRAGREGGAAFFATVSRLDGYFGMGPTGQIADAVSGGLAGLAKTAAQEWPEVACKALDLAGDLSIEDAATAILDEALTFGPGEVGLSARGRVAPRLAARALATDAALEQVFAPGDPVIVTGGARGITADVAVALARAWQPLVVLMGRSALPDPEPEWLAGLESEAEIKRALMERATARVTPREIGEQCARALADREIHRNLARIAEAGATRVIYCQADARDAAAVREAVSGVRRSYGPIRGLLHGAGVLADRLIEEKTDEQFESVYSTKVAGLRTLLDALESDDLRALVFFSSSTARFGRKGQADYAAANEVLNKLARAEAEHRPGCRVLSVNWGPWAGGMVTPSLAHVFAEEGIGLIEPAEGAGYLVRELGSGAAQRPVEVVILGGGTDLGRLSGVAPVTPHEPAPAEAAEEPVAEDPSLALAFEHGVSVADMPVLASHVLDGRAVLPAALMIEMLAHGAMHANPGLRFRGLADFRVFKGILLGAEERCVAQVWTRRAAKRDGAFAVTAELRSAGEDGKARLHARAEVLLGNTTPRAGEPMAAPTGLAPWPTGRAFYGPQMLFHGPDMQAIQSVDGCGEAGVVARLSSALRPAEWIAEPLRGTWIAEPLLLDGAFQLLVLWSSTCWNCPSLPTRVESYEQYVAAFPAAGARAVARVTASAKHEAAADVEFLDPATGALLARLKGYHCVIDASLASAFRRNQLPRG